MATTKDKNDSKGKPMTTNQTTQAAPTAPAPTPTIASSNGTPFELSKIHADYSWNSRSERNVVDMADTESAGFDGFKENLATGQLTAVILRNTNGKTLKGEKTDKPYELVCGFRRHRSATVLAAEKRAIAGLPMGTILGEIRDIKTVQEARIINGAENTARKNLKAPDMCFLVRELTGDGMTQMQIAAALNITQGWVSKLGKIASLPQPVLDHWRENKPIAAVQTKDGQFEIKKGDTTKELTQPEMFALAEMKSTPEELTARYIRAVKPQIIADGPDAGSKGEDKVLQGIVEMAKLMGCLVRAGVLENGSLDWNRVIGPRKKGYPIDCGKDDSQERLLTLGDAADEAFKAEVIKGAKGSIAAE